MSKFLVVVTRDEFENPEIEDTFTAKETAIGYADLMRHDDLAGFLLTIEVREVMPSGTLKRIYSC